MSNRMIKLTIDDIPVEVEKGKTILEAAQSVGIRIPTLCHDRRLTPFGACRLCVVQEKGKSELLPSCFTPAKNGMEMITQSPKIFESRRLQLQFILLNHPMICPRCEKEGDCGLQTLVYEYGVNETIYPWEKVEFPVDDFSPLLQRDPNKCILCGRCVRICDEVQGIGELSFTQRGIQTAIDTDFHRSLKCEFCGQCLDTCPVGAITSRCFDYSSKVWELQETTTPCPYCSCGCLVTIGSKGGEVKRVFSEPECGPSDGNLCVKGRFGWDFVDHPERLQSPLLRVNGNLKEVSWEEALRLVAQELEEIKDQYSPDAIACVLSQRLTNEEYYLFGKLFRSAIGTHQIGQTGNGDLRGLTRGLKKTLGLSASTNSIREIRNADCLLLVGVDPAQTHPIIKNEIHLAIRRNRAQLIVLGSYDIGLSRATQISPLFHPNLTLLERPGMEVSVLNGMMGVILREALEDKEFVKERTEGIEVLRERMLASLEEELLNREELKKAARAFAQAKNAMILIGSGSWSHLSQEEVAIASSNLSLITGHLGRESSGIFFLLEKCNAQGAIDMGVFSDDEETEESHLLQKISEGRAKALYVIGEDPLSTSSHPEQLRKALAGLRFLVVQELFLTETAKMAHVVLPACSFVEKEGTFTNLERRVQRLNPFRPPLHQSKSDFEIFLRLLKLLEYPVDGETPEAVFGEITKTIANYQGLQEGEQWPSGERYLYSEGFPMGRAKLIALEGKKPQPKPEAYPFYLIQRSSLFQSGLLSLKSDFLRKVAEKPHLEMNPEDAQLIKIENGEVVEVSTQKGRSMKMKVEYSSKPVSGVITLPYPCSILDEGGISFAKVERLKGG